MRRSTSARRVASLAVIATVALVLSVASVGAVAASSVVAPAAGGNGAPVISSTQFNLAQVGYQQAEFFLSGNATAYKPAPDTTLTGDGKWKVVTDGTAPYKTRVVVYRPSNPARFNGTVYVEWLNVSGGIDAAPDWSVAHNEIIRQGGAYVGVSAQQAGLFGSPQIPGSVGIVGVDPVRYGSLVHPGDSFSYDIFSQAGQAVKTNNAQLLGGLRPRKVIADGESQSAFRMTTYINGVHPLVNVFDGFMVHSNGASVPLSQPPERALNQPPQGLQIRNDTTVPVFLFQTETDLVIFQSVAARQPDSSKFRLWEVAGTAHADMYTLQVAATDTGDIQSDRDLFNLMLHPTNTTAFATCTAPINAGPQHYAFQAAVHHLNDWVSIGKLPPTAPRLQTTVDPAHPFVLDGNGNVVGGVRTPEVDAPVATLSGLGQTGNFFCVLFGTTVPLTAGQLAALYPSHTAFSAKWTAAIAKAVMAGYVLPNDGSQLATVGLESNVGR